MHDLGGTRPCFRGEIGNGATEQVVRVVVKTAPGDLASQQAELLAEVEALGRTISRAKAEIAALQVGDITDSHIPTATDELDAIVAHTAVATDSILEVCETLDEVAAGLSGAAADQLARATTRIYEACSFQDITGQRITKVVHALKMIDEKVAHILATFRVDLLPPVALAEPDVETDADLLNGPQLPVEAMGQSDIDRLLASFE